LSAAQREALELAREETFTPQERDAIERADEEVDQVRRTWVALREEVVQAEERAVHQAAEAHRSGLEAGELRARRSVLLMLLEAAAVSLSPSDRARIEACDDLAALDRWIRRAPTAATTSDLFAPLPGAAPRS